MAALRLRVHQPAQGVQGPDQEAGPETILLRAEERWRAPYDRSSRPDSAGLNPRVEVLWVAPLTWGQGDFREMGVSVLWCDLMQWQRRCPVRKALNVGSIDVACAAFGFQQLSVHFWFRRVANPGHPSARHAVLVRCWWAHSPSEGPQVLRIADRARGAIATVVITILMSR